MREFPPIGIEASRRRPLPRRCLQSDHMPQHKHNVADADGATIRCGHRKRSCRRGRPRPHLVLPPLRGAKR